MRQLLYYLAIVLSSTSAFQATAQSEGAGVDVEQVASGLVVGPQGGELRAFSAKFLCGRIEPQPVQVGVRQPGPGVRVDVIGSRSRLVFDPRFPLLRTPNLLPGDYLTSITIYNPNGVAVALSERAIVTLPVRGDDALGGAGGARQDRLPPRRGIELDCPDIVDLLPREDAVRIVAEPPAAAFVSGVLAIETAGPDLAVTAVFTFRPATD
jgi:hypothetical protein